MKFLSWVFAIHFSFCVYGATERPYLNSEEILNPPLIISYNKNAGQLAEVFKKLKANNAFNSYLKMKIVERDYDFELISDSENIVSSAVVIPANLYSIIMKSSFGPGRKVIKYQLGAADILLLRPKEKIKIKNPIINISFGSGEFEVFKNYLKKMKKIIPQENFRDKTFFQLESIFSGKEQSLKDEWFIVNADQLTNFSIPGTYEVENIGQIPYVLVAHEGWITSGISSLRKMIYEYTLLANQDYKKNIKLHFQPQDVQMIKETHADFEKIRDFILDD